GVFAFRRRLRWRRKWQGERFHQHRRALVASGRLRRQAEIGGQRHVDRRAGQQRERQRPPLADREQYQQDHAGDGEQPVIHGFHDIPPYLLSRVVARSNLATRARTRRSRALTTYLIGASRWATSRTAAGLRWSSSFSNSAGP